MSPELPPLIERLPPAARRALALALLLPPPLLAWALLGAPWLAEREALAARASGALAVEERALTVAARAPALSAERASLAAVLGGAAGVPGATHALAGAELQRRLREAAQRAGAALRSLETLPEEPDGMVALRGQLSAGPAALVALLAEIEGSGWGFAQVTALTVAASAGPVVPGEPRRLEVQIALRVLRGEGS
jgi:hypothetical protein